MTSGSSFSASCSKRTVFGGPNHLQDRLVGHQPRLDLIGGGSSAVRTRTDAATLTWSRYVVGSSVTTENAALSGIFGGGEPVARSGRRLDRLRSSDFVV